MSERRLPPPWSAEQTDACFIVRDANGAGALACVYFEDESPGGSFAQYRTSQQWRARPRRSGTKQGLVGAFLIWIKKRLRFVRRRRANTSLQKVPWRHFKSFR